MSTRFFALRILGRSLVVTWLFGCSGSCGPSESRPQDAGARVVDASRDSGRAPADASPRTDLGEPVDSGRPLRVYFVGNSYTYYNDLPNVTATIAEASGARITVDSLIRGGASLSDHWNKSGARAHINAGNYDTVVLQGQSTEPISAPQAFAEYAALLSDAAQHAGAETVFFATWARHSSSTIYDADLVDPAAMARALEEGYRAAAAPNMDDVARVGAAWELARAELPEIALHAKDGTHPTAEGTILAACVMVQALTGRTPVVPDPAPLSIPQERAVSLCALAPRVRDPVPSPLRQ